MLSYDGVIRKRLQLKGHPPIPPYSPQPDPEPQPPVQNPPSAPTPSPTSPPSQSALRDSRTDAQKRYDEVLQQRENERLRREAQTSYKDHVEAFNKRLSEEPEHYDLFKTSFTK
eukprot:GFKZ01001597.1.p2 GENE.GFKZ01001597.1~~GFKZ01001597.1.p2  ORF type:complete len:114 (+),score=13.69 GFKZ01001597.1:103-444(+)